VAADPKKPMAPAMLTLIDELARRAARDYLTERAAQDSHFSQSGSNRDALPDLNKAA
jgi:hypothetical protein